MATIHSFEELDIWKLARELSSDIFKLIQNGDFKNDFGLINQINNSSGSIMDNYAEGFERGGNKEFFNFLVYTKGSCGETRSQILRAFERN